MEDGTIQVSGNDHMKQSGLHPAALGEAILLAWAKTFQKTTSPAAMDSEDDTDDDLWADKMPERRPAKPSNKKLWSQTARLLGSKIRICCHRALKCHWLLQRPFVQWEPACAHASLHSRCYHK